MLRILLVMLAVFVASGIVYWIVQPRDPGVVETPPVAIPTAPPAPSGSPEEQAMRNMMETCPAKFEGSDNYAASWLNQNVVAKVNSVGTAPDDATVKTILEAGIQAPWGAKEVAAFKAAMAVKPKRPDRRLAVIEAEGCGISLIVWKDFAVAQLSEPCEPLVALFERTAQGYRYVCVTEIMYSEAVE